MKSKITGGETTLLFTATVLNKYPVNYYRCNDTGFIQTEEPYWLDEAYSNAITQLDIGLPMRNIMLSEKVSKIILLHFNHNGRFLDSAGGYGLFTRLMRDNGFDYYTTDDYCTNLFANYFSLQDVPAGTLFELTTAFEVFEHLANPLDEIRKMTRYSDNLLFSTELQPESIDIKDVNDWWYFAPETGQHIAFYTRKSLEVIAEKLGYNFYTDNVSLHLFSKKRFDGNPLQLPMDSFLVRKAKKYLRKADERLFGKQRSLLQTDYQYIKNRLNSSEK